MEDVVGKDEVSAKTASLERKKIQSTKSFFIWQFPHAFDHTGRLNKNHYHFEDEFEEISFARNKKSKALVYFKWDVNNHGVMNVAHLGQQKIFRLDSKVIA